MKWNKSDTEMADDFNCTMENGIIMVSWSWNILYERELYRNSIKRRGLVESSYM